MSNKITIVPNHSFQIEIDGVKWLICKITYDDLAHFDNLGYHVSDWAWEHAKYEAYRVDTSEYHFVSHFYKKDIKEIMACA